MRRTTGSLLAVAVALTGAAGPALAEKDGGTLRAYHRDNAPSGSIHEEATISTVDSCSARRNARNVSTICMLDIQWEAGHSQYNP